MLRPRLITAFALLLAPCWFVGCDDADTVEPSVGGATPTAVDGDADLDGDADVDMNGDVDPMDERPSNELEDES